MDQFYAILWSSVGVAVTGLMSWLVVVITNFFNSKIKDKKMAKIMSDLSTIVLNSVQTVFQTFVDVLKKDGKFDSEKQAEAKERALTIINSQLTPEIKEYISANFGDIQEYLKNQIESTIYMLKK